MDKQNLVYPYNVILFSNKSNELIHAATGMNLNYVIFHEKKPDAKHYILSNSVYIKCPEKAHL